MFVCAFVMIQWRRCKANGFLNCGFWASDFDMKLISATFRNITMMLCYGVEIDCTLHFSCRCVDIDQFLRISWYRIFFLYQILHLCLHESSAVHQELLLMNHESLLWFSRLPSGTVLILTSAEKVFWLAFSSCPSEDPAPMSFLCHYCFHCLC